MKKNTSFKIVKYTSILIILVLVFFIIRSVIIQDNHIKEIKGNPEICVGTIILYKHSGVSGRRIEYEYYIDKVRYENDFAPDNSLNCELGGYSNCIGKEYQVIYSKKNPQNSYLLCNRYAYKKFGLQAPLNLQ